METNKAELSSVITKNVVFLGFRRREAPPAKNHQNHWFPLVFGGAKRRQRKTVDFQKNSLIPGKSFENNILFAGGASGLIKMKLFDSRKLF